MVFALPGGAGADLDNLMHMHSITQRRLRGDHDWPALAAGPSRISLTAPATAPGGNVRVAQADSRKIGRGKRAKLHAHRARNYRDIIENLGRPVAAPDPAQARLGADGQARGRP